MEQERALRCWQLTALRAAKGREALDEERHAARPKLSLRVRADDAQLHRRLQHPLAPLARVLLLWCLPRVSPKAARVRRAGGPTLRPNA